MFDKIPSLKDFIIYVVPGIIICFFSLDIYNLKVESHLTNDMIAKNASLSFIGIIFSFLVGFLFSQLQIILFGRIFKAKYKAMCTIKEFAGQNTELKNVITDRIKSVFGLTTINEDDYLIVFLCLNYVKSKSNDQSHSFIDRHNNMSSFAIVTILPLAITVADFLLRTQLGGLCIGSILLIFLMLLYILVRRIVLNFRSDYYKNIFRLFLVLSA